MSLCEQAVCQTESTTPDFCTILPQHPSLSIEFENKWQNYAIIRRLLHFCCLIRQVIVRCRLALKSRLLSVPTSMDDPRKQMDAALVAASVAKHMDARFLRLDTSTKIDWAVVTATTRVWTPRECQRLWRWAAYGENPSTSSGDELLPDSDGEDDFVGLAPAVSSSSPTASAASSAAWPPVDGGQSYTKLYRDWTDALTGTWQSGPPAATAGASSTSAAGSDGGGTPTAGVGEELLLHIRLAYGLPLAPDAAGPPPPPAAVDAAIQSIVGPPPPSARTAFQLFAEHYWAEAVEQAAARGVEPAGILRTAWDGLTPALRAQFTAREATEGTRVAEALRRYRTLVGEARRLLLEAPAVPAAVAVIQAALAAPAAGSGAGAGTGTAASSSAAASATAAAAAAAATAAAAAGTAPGKGIGSVEGHMVASAYAYRALHPQPQPWQMSSAAPAVVKLPVIP